MITLWNSQNEKGRKKKKKLQRVFYAIIDRLMFNDSYRFTASDCSKDENECVKKSY